MAYDKLFKIINVRPEYGKVYNIVLDGMGKKMASQLDGKKVDVTGISKGKGFQGVVKRHGFHGGPGSHGQKHTLRSPGSIGSGGVQKVFKGVKMAGRMGSDRIPVKGLRIVKVDSENNILAVSGAVPGRRGTVLEIVAK